MLPWVFVYTVVLSALALVVAFVRLPKRDGDLSPRIRRVLVVGAVVCLVPVLLTVVFRVYPKLALSLIPLDVYARIEWEYWLPFAVLAFAFGSHLVRPRNRRSLLLLACVVAVFAVQQKVWHVVRPTAYDLEGRVVDGICFQSTGYTCGAASAVTLLNVMGVKATEGEMAELMRTPPGRGVSDVAAAYGLKRKLARALRSERVSLEAVGPDQLDNLPTPFLVGLKFKIWCDHMVCVLDIDKDAVVVGNPLTGREVWPRPEFDDEVRGLAVVVRGDR